MKILKLALKWFGLFILFSIVLLIATGTLFVNLSPQFGRTPSDEQKVEYAKTDHYKDGIFVNELESVMDINVIDRIQEYFKNDPSRQPSIHLPVAQIDSLEVVNYVAPQPRLTWFGHSAFLLEIDQYNILLDPMLSETPAPHPWLGQKRYSDSLPLEIEELPFIDFVIFSHDHYDHLDYETLIKIKHKVGQFYVPLGVGNHLREWGVPEHKIHELDWWDEISHNELKLVCTPSRHFSGRGLSDRAQTLWSSWIIQNPQHKIYFSGDGGYGPHFSEIGEKYGPFDLGLMECGQYHQDWHAIHMFPEETAQAGVDIKAKRIVPIHWGAFTLSLHSWTDPIERVIKAADKLQIPLSTPKLGVPFTINGEGCTTESWWNKY